MATYAFSLTREQMARKVLGKLGALDPNDPTSAQDLVVVSDAMDMRMKELHALGILWFNVAGAQTDVALTSGTATASLSAITDFLFPVSMMLAVGNDQFPIEIIGHAEYQAIQDKARQGEPENVFISGETARFYPVPQQNYTANLTYQAIAADAEISQPLDLGAGMARSFIDVIAGDLIDEYQVQEPQASRLIARQGQGLAMLRTLNAQRVNATTTQPSWY